MSEEWKANLEKATREYVEAKDGLDESPSSLENFETKRQLLLVALMEAYGKVDQIRITMARTHGIPSTEKDLIRMETDGHIH